MWWEALPSFGAIVIALSVPPVFNYVSNLLFLGTPVKRKLFYWDDAHNFLRDMRISGENNAYKQIGLDCLEPIPEKPEEKPCVCP